MNPPLQAKNILVTGGSGFIGTNLVTHFLAEGHKVLNLDLAEPRLAAHRPYWQRVDLMDKEGLNAAILHFAPQLVVHLAARTDLDGKTMADYAVNTVGTANLLEVLGRCQPEHVLLTSSMLVCRPGHIPVDAFDFDPGTVYGESKVQMEKIIRDADPGFRWNIIRPTSIWGPWFGTPYKDFFDRVLAGRMFHIGGMTSATKTYGFVLNAVHQIHSLLLSAGPRSEVFYLGDDPPLNIRTWADEIASFAGKPRPRVIPYPLIRLAAWGGDLLAKAGIHFPMTSFRLKNMTTDNILPLENLKAISGPDPYRMSEAIRITMDWMKHNNQ